VADGMGGHEAGDVASLLAVEVMRELLAHAVVSRSTVLDAVRRADGAVADEAARTSMEMGTTLCGIALTGGTSEEQRALVFNVGDSRAYLLRDGALQLLTHDHSVVQELVDHGEISEEEAETHAERHVVTRSLGTGLGIDIDWWTLEPRTDDRFLVASDGLTKELGAEQLAMLLARSVPPEQAVTDLVEAALDAGGRDNVTAIVIDVEAVGEVPDVSPLDDDTHPRRRNAQPQRAVAEPGQP
jgi:protein phosphatase